MQSVTLLVQIPTSGKLTLSTRGKKDAEIMFAHKKIEVNIEDKGFIKDVMAAARKGNRIRTENTGENATVENAPSMRDIAVDIAEELKEAGITITLSYKDGLVATIGFDAHPLLTLLITGTTAIEINSLTRLLELGV